MADNIQATPRNEFLGLLADAMYGGLEYMKDPRRTQQMQGLAGLLESTGIPKTTERMAYGEPLTNIGRANVPLLKPETAEAMMTVAPMLPKGMKITKDLPVGMSIKDVGKSAITREGNPIQGAVVLVGDKIFMGRTHGDALNRAVYEGVVRKEGGKYIYPKGAEVNSDLFMTKDGQIIDRLQASKMFDIGASETAIKEGLMQNNPPRSMTVDSYIEEAKALKKQREQSAYPQQAALDLAQKRAALPVEQGGLGLPASNTAADRAKAMGFDVEAYHGTSKEIDFPAFQGNAAKQGQTFVALDAAEANVHAPGTRGSRVMPLLVKPGKMAPGISNWGGEDAYAELAKRYGRESFKVRDDYNSPINISILNPANIRSRFAAFDPFRKDVATATAMGVALPDLLAAEPTPEELKRRQSSGLLFP